MPCSIEQASSSIFEHNRRVVLNLVPKISYFAVFGRRTLLHPSARSDEEEDQS